MTRRKQNMELFDLPDQPVKSRQKKPSAATDDQTLSIPEFELKTREGKVACLEYIIKHNLELARMDECVRPLDLMSKIQGHYAPKQVDIIDERKQASVEDMEAQLRAAGIDPASIVGQLQ